MSTMMNIAGNTYGYLTVTDEHKYVKSRTHWRCVCKCGKETWVGMSNLRNGMTKSCGCLQQETRGKSTTTHGYSGKGRKKKDVFPEYSTWLNMRNRCRYKCSKSFKDYGGRGIKVCERWDASFENFLADMGGKPSRKHSIERIDNNGNYEPSNCRWATKKEQMRNCSRSRFIDFRGERKTVAEWSEISGVNYKKLINRLNAGWSMPAATGMID